MVDEGSRLEQLGRCHGARRGAARRPARWYDLRPLPWRRRRRVLASSTKPAAAVHRALGSPHVQVQLAQLRFSFHAKHGEQVRRGTRRTGGIHLKLDGHAPRRRRMAYKFNHIPRRARRAGVARTTAQGPLGAWQTTAEGHSSADGREEALRCTGSASADRCSSTCPSTPPAYRFSARHGGHARLGPEDRRGSTVHTIGAQVQLGERRSAHEYA
jgi:hypothetical protein